MERKIIIHAALAGSVSVGCFGLASCERRASEPDTAPAETTASVTVEMVQEEPSQFSGQRLTLAGEVDEVYGSRAFVLEGNDWIGEGELLVLTRSPVTVAGSRLADDDDVIVTGWVRQVAIVELERELGWDLTPQIEVEIRGKPVLVADTIRTVEEMARWSETEEPAGTIVSAWTLYAVPDPTVLEGTKLDLQGVPVQAKAGDGVWLGFGPRNQFFTTLPPGFDADSIGFGDRVDVVGTLQIMPPVDEAMTRWNFSEALRPHIDKESFYVEATRIERSKAVASKAVMVRPEPSGEPTLQQRLDQLSQLGKDLGVEYEAQGGMVPLEAYAGTPQDHVGLGVYGEATVVDTMPTQGFFVVKSKNGKHVLVRMHATERAQAQPEVRKGQTVRFTALALEPGQLSQLELHSDRELEKMVREYDGFLAVNARSFEILEEADEAPEQGREEQGQKQDRGEKEKEPEPQPETGEMGRLPEARRGMGYLMPE